MVEIVILTAENTVRSKRPTDESAESHSVNANINQSPSGDTAHSEGVAEEARRLYLGDYKGASPYFINNHICHNLCGNIYIVVVG